MEIPGGGGSNAKPSGTEIQWDGGSNWKKPSVGVWIFSGTTHCHAKSSHPLMYGIMSHQLIVI